MSNARIAATGSRIAEYAQTKLSKGVRYNCVPNTKDAKEQAGKALAFIRTDFTFYDADFNEIPQEIVHSEYEQGGVTFLRLQFRYDKSTKNFLI